MNRREFLAATVAATAWPLAAQAQQPAMPRIGYLSSKGAGAEVGIVAAVQKGLAERGLIEGQNVTTLYRWSDGNYDRLPRLAADLIENKVDVIAASGLPATIAAKAATSTIPIVFRLAIDPVAFGLAQSLDRPGGNLPGVTMLFDPLTPKKLQLLHELAPHASSIGLLVNGKNQNAASHREHAETAARALGLQLTVLTASNGDEIEPAFAAGSQKSIGALLIGDDPLFDTQSAALVAAAAKHRIPTMYYVRDFVSAGGLISYGPSFDEMAKQVGIDIARILQGAKPAELPVQQPTRIELVVNLKTAHGIGLEVPTSILLRADEVIE